MNGPTATTTTPEVAAFLTMTPTTAEGTNPLLQHSMRTLPPQTADAAMKREASARRMTTHSTEHQRIKTFASASSDDFHLPLLRAAGGGGGGQRDHLQQQMAMRPSTSSALNQSPLQQKDHRETLFGRLVVDGEAQRDHVVVTNAFDDDVNMRPLVPPPTLGDYSGVSGSQALLSSLQVFATPSKGNRRDSDAVAANSVASVVSTPRTTAVQDSPKKPTIPFKKVATSPQGTPTKPMPPKIATKVTTTPPTKQVVLGSVSLLRKRDQLPTTTNALLPQVLPPSPPPHSLSLLTTEERHHFDAMLSSWLQDSFRSITPLVNATTSIIGSATTTTTTAAASQQYATAEYVSQSVLGVGSYHDLVTSTSKESRLLTTATTTMPSGLFTISLASMPLNDAAYMAGGVSKGIAAVLELQSILLTNPSSSSRRQDVADIAAAPAGGATKTSTNAEASLPPTSIDLLLRELHLSSRATGGGQGAALMNIGDEHVSSIFAPPPALTLALMNTGLTDAALRALIPSRSLPTVIEARQELLPPAPTSSSSLPPVDHHDDTAVTINPTPPPQLPADIRTNVHALLLHSNRLTSLCLGDDGSCSTVTSSAQTRESDAGTLRKLILASPNLKVLSLHNNPKLCNGTSAAGKLLAEAIVPLESSSGGSGSELSQRSLSSLKVLPAVASVKGPSLPSSSSSFICTLYLSNVGLGDEGVFEFGRIAFPRLTTLTKCTLGGNRITDRGAVAIHRWLTTTTTTTSSSSSGGEGGDTPEIYANFSEAIDGYTSTTSSSSTFVGAGAAIQRLSALRPPVGVSWTPSTRVHCKTLEVLDLSKNLIGGDGALWLSTLGIADVVLR
ncbi:GPI-anchored surface protein, putative [Bodo saltans]|uniref:GPI-anchored surface protein, putative n=1 Tax=Bodo saltans TaxID=75058 RepID=A0A0S4J191_BODSA|nr:GPI-anchored surface protein, putative [Bodo saltans]|eukprot:CUG07094.1 GPI-anchored surface protein, putative [Bodo saltans]